MKLIGFSLLFVFIILSHYTLSQDVIVKTNGEKIEVNILEIRTNYIKYQTHNELNGPTRIIAVDQVSEIIYEDGQFDTFNKILENPIIKKSKYAPKAIEGAGFGLDFLPGIASTSRFVYQYDPANPTDLWKKDLTSNFSLSIRISNKFYFDVKPKWRSGIMLNWMRLGFTNNVFGNQPTGFLNVSPLNVGTCNIFKLSENMAIEGNFGVGLMLSVSEYSELASLNLNPEIKFRYKVLAVGVDYVHSQAFGNKNENRYNIFSLVLGLKF